MHIYRLINRAANSQRRVFSDLSFPRKFSAAQGRVLHFLLSNSDNELFQRDIEREFGLRGSSATALLSAMEENGLIGRVSSEKDARYKKICLTEKAFIYEDEINDNMKKLDSIIMSGISEDELNAWIETTKKIIDNLDSGKKELSK